MEHTVIKADGLTKSYSLGTFFNRIRINALDDVNFQVRSDRPIIANLLQCIQEDCNVYHSGFTWQTPNIVDLFVYWYPKRGVVHVHVDYVFALQ